MTVQQDPEQTFTAGPKHITRFINEAMALVGDTSGSGTVIGLSTGFDELDKATSGLYPGELTIIAGRPAMGKTLLALHIAGKAAISQKLSVAYFSLGVSGTTLAQRLLCQTGRIDIRALITGELAGQQWDTITATLGIVIDAPLFIDDDCSLDHQKLGERVEALQVANGRISLIVIDDFQQLSANLQRDKDIDAVKETANALWHMARKLGVHVIVLSDLGRRLENRKNKRPCLSDLKCTALKRNADSIMLLYREEAYYPETRSKECLDIILAKQRRWATGTVTLHFSSACCRLDPL